MASSYSAMKLKMGNWDYYVVRMKMAEVAKEVKFASEVNDDRTLDEVIQRELKESRAKQQIVRYLQKNEERFFGSIVVAALGGEPTFYAIEAKNDPKFAAFQNQVSETFGVLFFDDSLKIYALDGQHRLFAIKELIDGGAETPAPVGFSDETISVIFVIPQKGASPDEFRKSYRRLFTSLNRHAKPMNMVTNIIMDEDDRFAIITRYLISEYDFFSWDGSPGGEVIDTKSASENMGPTSTKFATLVGLYKMNQHFLWDHTYQSEFGNPTPQNPVNQHTPTEDEVEDLQQYLVKIWDCLLLTLDVLKKPPLDMRQMNADGTDGKDNILWFRPVAQTGLLAPLARRLMDDKNITPNSSEEEILKALKPLSMIPDQLHHNLWRDLLIARDPNTHNWKMVTDAPKVKLAYTILQWLTGCETLSEDDIDELQASWSSSLIPVGDNKREQDTFKELEDIREKIVNL